METIVAALGEQHAELSALLSGLNESDWQRPSQCEGWTVSDVVLHLAQTDDLAIGSATGRFVEAVEKLASGLGPASSIDEGVEQMVSRERGEPGEVVRQRWQASADSLRAVLTACDPRDRVMWVAGEMSARTLATTRLSETWIHTRDVAFAFGVELAATDRLWHIARLAWRTLPYAFSSADRTLAGPVAFELEGPDGAAWEFVDESTTPTTTIRGDALELCLVAARRVDAGSTALQGEGPDAKAVLELVRTYAS